MANGTAPPIPEIVVPGRQPGEPRNPADVVPALPDFPSDAARDQDRDKDAGGGSGAFVPPVALPIIEEIVTFGTRPATISSASGGSATGFALPAAIAVIVGFTIRAIFEKLGDQIQDEAVRRFMSVRPRRLPDTEVQTIADLVEELPLERIPQPQPLITPDVDPGIMVPFIPRTMPTVEPVPDFQFETAPAPPNFPAPRPVVIPTPLRIPLVSPTPFQFPFPSPVALPQRFAQPLPLPVGFPAPSPTSQPQAQPQPQPTPQPGTRPVPFPFPLSVPQPTPQQFAFPQPQPQAQPQPNFDRAGCPPCPRTKKEEKKREEPRTQCFKQLVKQGALEADDTVFNFEEIDCLTGKDL